MYDRIPSPGKENRVSITQDNGQVITGVLAYADDATQEGSAYTKGNVLPDDVCTAYGIDTETSEPKDAFIAARSYTNERYQSATVYTDMQLAKRMPTTFQQLMTGRLI